jgi:hypothetical protein
MKRDLLGLRDGKPHASADRPIPPAVVSPRDSARHPLPAYVSEFLAARDGLSLTKAFMRIKDSKVRRRIVDLVKQIAGDE